MSIRRQAAIANFVGKSVPQIDREVGAIKDGNDRAGQGGDAAGQPPSNVLDPNAPAWSADVRNSGFPWFSDGRAQ